MRFDDLFDVGARDGPEVVSDAILTVPNVLSLLRLLVMPLVYVDIVGDRPVRAAVVLLALVATDWVDGYVARRFDQVTKLGKLLDPISDRILIVLVVVAMAVAGLVPLWLVVALLARDVAVALATVWLGARGVRPPPVSRTGKAATFGLMAAFPTLLIAEVFAGPMREAVRAVALIGLAGSTALYYAAAAGYLRAVRQPTTADAD